MATGKSGFGRLLAQQYDKVLLLAAGLVLLVSLCYLAHLVSSDGSTRQQYESSLRAEPRTAVIAPQDLGALEKGSQALARPPRFLVPKADEAGIFTAEKRMACAFCRKPIPFGANSCVFCGKEQPRPAAADPNRSTAGDGIPDSWKRKYGLDVTDKELAAKDVDSDGFTVFEEFEAGTNPVDGKSYPDVVVRMRVKSFKGRALPFVFRSYSTLPDGKKSLAIFVPAESRTYYLKEGQPVAKTGFKVVRFIEKKEKRKDPKLGNMERVVDLSSIQVLRERDGKSAELVLDKPSGIIDQEAVLTLEMDQFEVTVETGSEFTLREKKYSVEKVDAVAKTVTIKESGGKTYVIPSL